MVNIMTSWKCNIAVFPFKLVILKCHFAAKLFVWLNQKWWKKLVSIIGQVISPASSTENWSFPWINQCPFTYLLSPAVKLGLYWQVGESSLFWWCDYQQVCVISSCLHQHWCNHSRSVFHAVKGVAWQGFMLRAKTYFVVISYNMDQILHMQVL